MSDKYKIVKGEEPYFVTFTIIEWLHVLENDDYKRIITDSIHYCQENKGLVIYAYCIMPNHVHMIFQAVSSYSVSEILRDLKRFTSRAIVNKLEEEKPEGYLKILDQFIEAGQSLKRIKKYKVWQDGNRAKLLFSNKFLYEKLNYIHNNPVEYGLCSSPCDYKFSSATNYAGGDGMIKVEMLSVELRTIR